MRVTCKSQTLSPYLGWGQLPIISKVTNITKMPQTKRIPCLEAMFPIQSNNNDRF